jgi:hypothetical protein
MTASLLVAMFGVWLSAGTESILPFDTPGLAGVFD